MYVFRTNSVSRNSTQPELFLLSYGHWALVQKSITGVRYLPYLSVKKFKNFTLSSREGHNYFQSQSSEVTFYYQTSSFMETAEHLIQKTTVFEFFVRTLLWKFFSEAIESISEISNKICESTNDHHIDKDIKR